MWPKALAQLFELLPHIARLLPAADRFLQSKTAGEESTHKALAQMAEDISGDLRRATASHEGLYRQLNEQGERLAQVEAAAQAARAAAESAEERAAGLERRVATSNALLAILLPLIVILVILTVLLLVRR